MVTITVVTLMLLNAEQVKVSKLNAQQVSISI